MLETSPQKPLMTMPTPHSIESLHMPPPIPTVTMYRQPQTSNQMPPSPSPPPLIPTTRKTSFKHASNSRFRSSPLLSPTLPCPALVEPPNHHNRQSQQMQIRPPARRSSVIVVPAARQSSLLPPPSTQPMLTRRGSLMLTATMRAMGQSLPPAALLALATTAEPTPTNMMPTPTLATNTCRRKSNQDNETDSEDDEKPTSRVGEASNQISEQLPPKRSSPPPYFRLETFMLQDHDATPPTSPVLPSTISQRPPAPLPPPLPCKATQIDLLFREITQTETSYVAALRGLVTQFFEPLGAFAKIHEIDLGAMAALHHATSTILRIHDELLRQLEPLQSSSPPLSSLPSRQDPFGVGFTGTLARLHALSHAFLSTIEYMKVYAFYCGSYLAAKQELESLQRKHPQLAAFTAQLNECARRGSQEEDEELPPLDINSSLIKPVQRICRYPLLFKNLLRNATGPEETLVLQQTLQKIEAVSTYVNDKVRESQQNARLYQLHQMLHHSSGIELLQPSRTLVYETWAHVTSLDAIRWPARLLEHFSFRRRRHSRCSSSLLVSSEGVPRDDWFRLSAVFGLGDNDRRSSATATTQSLRSHTSMRIRGGENSDRHTSFSAASTTTQYLSSPRTTRPPLPVPPPPLPCFQRRRSSGERSRLILLSDMLLMAKLRDHKLKIRRQICLSCAVVHDEVSPPPPPPPPSPLSSIEDDASGGELLSSVAAVSAKVADDETVGDAFTLEVAKVGRCACHHLSPLTLKRSPRLRSLSVFLSGRRGSGSSASSSSTGDLSQPLQHHEQQQQALPREELVRNPSSRKVSKTSSSRGLRYLEQITGIRAVKRYRVTCDSAQEKIKFLRALRQAIARSARLQSLGATHSGSGSELAGYSSGASKAVAIAVSLPVKIWRSIRSASDATMASHSATTGASSASQSMRRAGSVAITSPSSSVGSFQRDALGNLLQLEDFETNAETQGQVNAA